MQHSHQQALVLFAHGARDPRWAAPFQRLQAILQSQFEGRVPAVSVDLAFLELMTPNLPTSVATAVAAGCSQVTVVPVFLGQGGHVLRDLPLLLEQLRLDYPAVAFSVAQAVGEDTAVLSAIAQYCATCLPSNGA